MDRFNTLKKYSFKKDSWKEDWRALRNDCNLLTEWGIDILSKGLYDSIGSIVLETFYICKDHRNLFSNYYSKKFEETSGYAGRLHFFSKEGDDLNITEFLLDPKKYMPDYLGYSVIRPVKKHCIGRTIIDPYKLKKTDRENFFCLRTSFKSHIGGNSFEVKGYPYTSQDTDVTVCAHTALWGVCRYLSERYSLYGEIYPFDLINLTESSLGRTFPYRGMTYSDYCKILSEFGAYPILLRLKKESAQKELEPAEFKNLYTYVESGFPILASFHGHVVTIIGHTIEYKDISNFQRDDFIDSSYFLKQFIVIDDNFFPYQLLGRNDDPDNYGDKYQKRYTINSIVTSVCPLPEKVFLFAEKARDKALEYFEAYKPLLGALGEGPWVTRLLLTNNSAFQRRKLELIVKKNQLDKISLLVTRLRFPHFIWVMEVSPIDLYKKGLCSAEIVIDSTAGIYENSIIYMRIGNTLILDDKQKTFKDQPCQFYQYTHNLGEQE